MNVPFAEAFSPAAPQLNCWLPIYIIALQNTPTEQEDLTSGQLKPLRKMVKELLS